MHPDEAAVEELVSGPESQRLVPGNWPRVRQLERQDRSVRQHHFAGSHRIGPIAFDEQNSARQQKIAKAERIQARRQDSLPRQIGRPMLEDGPPVFFVIRGLRPGHKSVPVLHPALVAARQGASGFIDAPGTRLHHGDTCRASRRRCHSRNSRCGSALTNRDALPDNPAVSWGEAYWSTSTSDEVRQDLSDVMRGLLAQHQ